MNVDYEGCLKRGKIKPFSRGVALISKELETASSDLTRAEKTLNVLEYPLGPASPELERWRGAKPQILKIKKLKNSCARAGSFTIPTKSRR